MNKWPAFGILAAGVISCSASLPPPRTVWWVMTTDFRCVDAGQTPGQRIDQLREALGREPAWRENHRDELTWNTVVEGQQMFRFLSGCENVARARRFMANPNQIPDRLR